MPICIENLTHIYMPDSEQQTVALDNINLSINDGEFWGVIGHTGSGKTTFVQHLNGLIQPTSGKVIVNGIDLADKKTRLNVRKQVGMVFQYPEYQLFEETVEKDIAFGPINVGTDEENIQKAVRKAMEKVGLDYDTYAQKSPFELSGGEKRRVALAGILAMDPVILVLDEPMAGLDPQGRAEILSFIREQHRSGMTIIMVSHSMDDIAELCTHVAVMDHGKLVLTGLPGEIFMHDSELKEIGLALPQAAQMALDLHSLGFPIERGVYRMEELFQQIISGGQQVE